MIVNKPRPNNNGKKKELSARDKDARALLDQARNELNAITGVFVSPEQELNIQLDNIQKAREDVAAHRYMSYNEMLDAEKKRIRQIMNASNRK